MNEDELSNCGLGGEVESCRTERGKVAHDSNSANQIACDDVVGGSLFRWKK